MPSTPSAAPVHNLSQRWCALAEKRREHLIDLFQSGRWQHYYDEREFLEELRNAIGVAKRWRSIVNGVSQSAA